MYVKLDSFLGFIYHSVIYSTKLFTILCTTMRISLYLVKAGIHISLGQKREWVSEWETAEHQHTALNSCIEDEKILHPNPLYILFDVYDNVPATYHIEHADSFDTLDYLALESWGIYPADMKNLWWAY